MASGDLDRALAIYHVNIRLGQALLSVAGLLEVVLRNQFDTQLRRDWEVDWLLAASTKHRRVSARGHRLLTQRQIDDIDHAVRHLNAHGKKVDQDALVSTLMFGFWVNLTSPPATTTIWAPSLRRLFRSGSRADVFKLLRRANDLRNRAVHHEPLIFSSTSHAAFARWADIAQDNIYPLVRLAKDLVPAAYPHLRRFFSVYACFSALADVVPVHGVASGRVRDYKEKFSFVLVDVPGHPNAIRVIKDAFAPDAWHLLTPGIAVGLDLSVRADPQVVFVCPAS